MDNPGLSTRQDADVSYFMSEIGYSTFTYTPESQASDNSTNDRYFFHKDHLGSTAFLSDESGQAYQFLLYLPFGETMAEQNAASYSYDNPYRYTGKELDEVSGLYYYGARYYDPRVSLFISVDPLADKYPAWTPYHYVLNNPISNIDANGDTVRVYSQTIPSTKNQFRHLYLRVTTEDFDKVVEVWGLDEEKAARGTAIPKIYDFSELDDRPNIKEHTVVRPIDVPEGNTQFEEQILELGSFFGEYKNEFEDNTVKPDYIHLPTYGYISNNSNGYTNAIIEMSGGKLKDLPVNVPGVNDTKEYINTVHRSSCKSIKFPLYK